MNIKILYLRLKIRALLLIIVTQFLLFSFFVQAQEIPISKELASAIRPISTEEEVKIGREVAANVIAQFGLVEDEAINDYVNLVGLTVARVVPRQDIVYRFAILNSDIVNAFAVPGGFIFVSKGLINLLEDESQLAGVLGHEIAHVTQRHAVKEIQKSKIAQAAIPNYVKASAKQAEWMSQVTDLAIQMLWKGYAREDELESDRLGVEYARIAGYDAHSFIEVLEMIKSRAQNSNQNKEVKFLLSTHPKPEDRILVATERVHALSTGGEKLQERFEKSITKK